MRLSKWKRIIMGIPIKNDLSRLYQDIGEASTKAINGTILKFDSSAWDRFSSDPRYEKMMFSFSIMVIL